MMFHLALTSCHSEARDVGTVGRKTPPLRYVSWNQLRARYWAEDESADVCKTRVIPLPPQ